MRELRDLIHDDDIEAGAADLRLARAAVGAKSADGVCPYCGGGGFILQRDGTAKRCRCYAEQRLLTAQREARIQPALQKMTFEGFKLSCYPANAKPKGGKGKSYYELAREARDKANECCELVIRGAHPRGLLLMGQVGSGKTHLAAAMANKLLKNGRRVLFLVVPDFLDELRSSFGAEDADVRRLLDRAKHVEVLILDDLGNHNFTDWTRSVLFSVLNYRMNEGLTTLATTNLDAEKLQELLGTRSLSRLLSLCQPCMLASDRDIRLLGLEK
jgi:DNA replication protein DnaC